MVFDPINGLAQFEALRFLEQTKPITQAINYATINLMTIGAVFLITGLTLYDIIFTTIQTTLAKSKACRASCF